MRKHTEEHEKTQANRASLPFVRLSITGVFMGLANLVPGVSGGTMILVLGLYEEFIGAFSDLTRLRFSFRALVVVGILFGVSMLTIFGLAGVIQFLMETFLPGMLATFIGMTLGGVPLLHKTMRPLRSSGIGFAAAAFLCMGLIAFVLRLDAIPPSWGYFFIAGIAASAAMVLPGISGSYLLLIMGLYLPIIAGITDFKDGLKTRDLALLLEVGGRIILPVGLGLAVGLVVISNLLKHLLARHPQQTLGVLLGLLLGSVLGLYPFKETRFDKLPRHAVALADDVKELRISGFGWEASPRDPVFRNLKRLESGGLSVNILEAEKERPVHLEEIQRAAREKAVVIAYDIKVPREVRRAAAGRLKEPGPDLTNEPLEKSRQFEGVELIIVPNTAFSFPRLCLVLTLAAAGFLITFLLGKIDPKK